jgi:signal recognition particle receptor subunit beta
LQKRHTQGKTSKDPHSIPVLVAANKQDVFTSLPTGLVKRKLEEEIARVRQTKSKGMLDSGIGMEDDVGGDEESNCLGEYGSKEFRFKQMEEHGVDVVVHGGNVRGEGQGDNVVGEWWSWIGGNL